MPKKTKREKILAKQRLHAKSLPSFSEPIVVKQVQAPHVTTAQTTVIHNTDKLLTSYFLLDLKKSALLIAIIITLEIAIYFGTINNLGSILKF